MPYSSSVITHKFLIQIFHYVYILACYFLGKPMMALESESIKIVQNVKVEIINPWMASSIFEFQFFCCPECDIKSQNKQDFVNHASIYHLEVSFPLISLLHKLSTGA